MIAEEAKEIPNFEFVWITDGAGWKDAKRNLEETFIVLENLYNITEYSDLFFLLINENNLLENR